MISDETFPSDYLISDTEFEDEIPKKVKDLAKDIKEPTKAKKGGSTYDQSSSDEDLSSVEIEHSMETDRLLDTTHSVRGEIEDELTQKVELSFETSTSQKITAILPAPRAPIKRKKSFSCQNLGNIKKNGHTYDHVESKVKKLIENLAEDRRKTLLRHKSMPVCLPQAPAVDDQPEPKEKDINDLKRELRRKSIKIYELEEKCEMKDNQIYDLEKEKSKMKMVFDKLRVEIKELKEVERQFRHLKSQYSPNRTQRNVLIQTDDSGIDSSKDFSKAIDVTYAVPIIQNPVIRQLAFENSHLNQSHFSDINNTSSDNLIPEAELQLTNIDIQNDKGTDDAVKPQESQIKKKKRKLKFFSFVPCVHK